MQLSNMPDYRAHLSRHGHNLSHDFNFTSSTGHLLTVFAQHLNPKERIKGHLELFTRTQPLVGCPNADIEEYVDYFFVPYEMLWSGFGDSFFQVNEPYSSMITLSDGSLPVIDWRQMFDMSGLSDAGLKFDDVGTQNEVVSINREEVDFYGLDNRFFSYYRNAFHNFINPNMLFYSLADPNNNLNNTYQFPYDFYMPNVMPVVLMAYNCVYQNFYRLDDREVFVNRMYNIDAAMYDGDTLSQYYKPYVINFLSLKYRPRHFDYFTAGSVAPLINTTNINRGSANTSLLSINNYLSNIGIETRSPSGVGSVSIGDGVSTSQNIGNADVISTQSLRSMFAVEKLLSVTNRAKKTYDAQVMAHFGVSVPRDVKHQMQFIGQQKGRIHIGEVISTAGTDDNSLGDIAGKGYGNLSNNDIDFTAPCHGIVIGIFSAVPRVRYYVPLIKQWMLTNKLDFFMPEFEHLGMQPIYQWEAIAQPKDWNPGVSIDYTASTSIMGWQMRYQQFKEQISRVSPAFSTTLWYYNSLNSPVVSQSFNTWSSWIISQRPYGPDLIKRPSAVPVLKDYLTPPTLLNDLMAVQFPDVRAQYQDSQSVWHGGYFNVWGDDYVKFDLFSYATSPSLRKSFAWNIASLFYRDPLLHFGDFKFKLVSQMSDNTLPELASV